MKSKSIIQILIVLTIILTSYFVYKSFFVKKSYKDENFTLSDNVLSNTMSNKDNETYGKNTIENLEYKSTDSFGNEYIIKSETAESNLENENQLTLIKVSALIYLLDKPPIIISSDFAKHDKSSFNTNFYDNVKINYDEVEVEANNLDLIYNNNLISLYNINKAMNQDVELKADKIDFDMLTKDVSINMYKDSEKIKLIYK